MLNIKSEPFFQSYGFQMTDKQGEEVAGIHAIGLEKRTNHEEYNWNGMKREDVGRIIFQYTLKGKGKICINGVYHDLYPGKAFIVNIPSPHHYYLPEDSSNWEFIFITTYGKEAKKIFEIIKNNFGCILQLNEDASPVQNIRILIKKIQMQALQNKYELFAHAYSFLMDLLGYLENAKNNKRPKMISEAVAFIEQNYMTPLSLDDIVEHVQVSKYHFTRLFQQYTGFTPIRFVTKVRLENALKLLKKDELTVNQIAEKVGYSNGNYFNKVFSSFIGISPGKLRKKTSFLSFDNIIHY